MRIKYILLISFLWLGLFSFNAHAQTCIQQGGTLVGCVSPIGITYGNSDIGYFSSETAAAHAQGQYYITNRVTCKDCYNNGVTFKPYNYETWSCSSERTTTGTDTVYTRIGPEGKSTSTYTWIYATRVYVNGTKTGSCPVDYRNGSYSNYYKALDSNSIYAFIRCPANYVRTSGTLKIGQPYFGFLCRPRQQKHITSPQADYPNKDCADHNTAGSHSTKNPINLASKCKNETVVDFEIANATYPLSWMRFAGQRNSQGVWSFEGQRSIAVTNSPMVSGTYIGSDVASVDRRNGGSLVFTATPVSQGPRQWVSTSTSPTMLKEIVNGNARIWQVHQRNGEMETYNNDGVFVRKTSPEGYNHHYIYENSNPEEDGNGRRLKSIRDDFGNVIHLSYNPGYNGQTSVPAFSNNSLGHSNTIVNLMSSSLPQSVSDGSRTVSYSWHTDYLSAFMYTTPQLLAVESPDGGIT